MRLSTALAACALLLPAAARADLFSPGPLSRAHAELEGLKSCTRCHVAGQQLSPERCLDCHKELKARIADGRGFHGRLPANERACESCHHEHQGRDFPLVEWAPSKKGFDHARTGWPLQGKHAGLDCGRCHQARRVADPQVRAGLAKNPARETFLGLPTRCSGCHFDEHRGQLGTDCERCHSESAFRPPARFDHAKTAYPLEGKHAQVACEKCHPREEDRATPEGAFPAPRGPTFARFRGVAHASCADCHRDPHGGRFGPNCVSCHSPAGWREVRNLEKERGFHEKTRFPLRGAHASAPCRACHGQPAKYKGIPFAECADCHADAHLGQISGPAPGRPPDCARCHGLTSFKPPAFELEDHARTGYPLEGAHRAVGCALCHAPDPRVAEKVPAATRAQFRNQRRPERFSFARFDLAAERCEDCHRDPHAGQFARPCAGCHEVAGFRKVRFEHAKESRFALTGRHAGVACAKCHRPGDDGVVRYRPLDLACDACHADPHLGQFASDGRTDCARCHSTDGFKPARFEHRPPATSFLLEGRHAAVACERCHPEVEVAPGERARRFTPLPKDCEGCHEDFHRGAFRGRESLSSRGVRGAAAGGEGTRCAACHSVEGWAGAAINHARTGFPLEGAHAKAACAACHLGRYDAALPTTCAGCHRDVHGGARGARCEGCHDATSWRSRFGPEAHRRTNFPLSGRHAFLPCTECHEDLRDRAFTRAARPCYDCHQRDYQRTALTSFDHAAAGISTACQECHGPYRFAPARFAQHDRCFELGGDHAGIRCLDCHTRLSGIGTSGACATNTAACTRCHEHSCAEMAEEHREVAGFQCKDRKCYECHRFAEKD